MVVVNAGTGLRVVEGVPSEYSHIDVDSAADKVVSDMENEEVV